MWQQKAHTIIAELCRQSYHQANRKKDGTLYQRHRPYSVPPMAQALVEALGTNDEEGAKALFHVYHCLGSI